LVVADEHIYCGLTIQTIKSTTCSQHHFILHFAYFVHDYMEGNATSNVVLIQTSATGEKTYFIANSLILTPTNG